MNVKDDAFMTWMNLEFPASNMADRKEAYANMKMLKRIFLAGWNSALENVVRK